MSTTLPDLISALKANAPGVTLVECPIGLFISEHDQLCLKTEYRSDEGRIDAYIVSSGEMFWGEEPQTMASQRKQLVRPLKLSTGSEIALLIAEIEALRERAAKAEEALRPFLTVLRGHVCVEGHVSLVVPTEWLERARAALAANDVKER